MTEEEFLEATSSAPVVLAVFRREGKVHPLIMKAAQQLADVNQGIRVIELGLDELSGLVDEYLEEMDPLSGTLNFEGPGLALYRQGKLVTTFNPWLNLSSQQLNEDSVDRQLRAFLKKLVPEQLNG